MSETVLNTIKEITPELSKGQLEEKFKKIAEDLIHNYCIVKPSENPNETLEYHFMELEFYYYSPEHTDLITYPRKAQAGQWFFHASGVDICFPSMYDEEGNHHFFGGILIRALSKHLNEEEIDYITGPLNCCYELFDQFNAFDTPKDFPRIVPKKEKSSQNVETCGRYFKFNKTSKQKLDQICKSWGEHDPKLNVPQISTDTFEGFLKEPYCFFDPEAFVRCKKKYPNRSYAIPGTGKQRLHIKD